MVRTCQAPCLFRAGEQSRCSDTHWANGGRRPAEDLLHVVGDQGGRVECLGEHGHVGVGEVGAEAQTDEPLPYRGFRHLPILQRTTQDGADDLDQLGVGEGLRAGQRDPLSDEILGQQRPRRDLPRCRSRRSVRLDAAAYGPVTTSPARICADHMPAKFVAKTAGRRLTQARPESTASCSTSLLRSPRKRDGCREKSSSALIADSATSLVTPARRHWVHHRFQLLAQRPGVEEYRRRAR